MSSYEELGSRDSTERARSPSPILSLDGERHLDTLSAQSLQKEDVSTKSLDSVDGVKAEESYHDASPRTEKVKSLFSEKWTEDPSEIEQRAAAGFITWNTSILILDLFWAMLIPVLFMSRYPTPHLFWR